MPRYFEPNWGIAEPAVKYLSRGGQYSASFAADGLTLNLGRSGLGLRFVNGAPHRYEAVDPLVGKSHYLAQDISNVPHFGRLRARGIYPGVDVEYYPQGAEIEFDLVIAAGADPTQIRVIFPGSSRVEIQDGDLIVHSDSTPLRIRKPIANQGSAAVAVAFRLMEGGVGFDVGPYNPALPLTIDPVLSYMTFNLTGPSSTASSIAADQSGVYIAGQANLFPVTAGAYNTTPPAANKTFQFLAKFSPDGSQLLYATYLGEAPLNITPKVVLSPAGDVYVVRAGSLAVTQGAINAPITRFQTIARLNGSGSAATLVMAAPDAQMVIDNQGNHLLLLDIRQETLSWQPPEITPGAYRLTDGRCRVLKINPAGTAIIWSLRYGGSRSAVRSDFCMSIAVDGQGRVWVSGTGSVSDLPATANAVYATKPASGYYGFFGRLSSDGSTLEYSSYLPAPNGDPNGVPGPVQLRVGPNDDIYVRASSSDAIGTPGAYIRSSLNRPTFVLRLTADGVLRFLTFLPVKMQYFGGFSGSFTPYDMFVDATGNFTFAGVGYYYDRDLDSVTPDALAHHPRDVGYLVTMKSDGSDVLYSTYLPSAPMVDSASGNRVFGIAYDGVANAYFLGGTTSALLVPGTSPVLQHTPDSYQPLYYGFFGKINMAGTAPACTYSLSTNPGSTLPVQAGRGQLTVLTGPDCPWQLNGFINSQPLDANSKLRLIAAPNLARRYQISITVSQFVTTSSIASGMGPGTLTFEYDARNADGNPSLASQNITTTFSLYGLYTTTPQPQTIAVTQPYIPCASLVLSPAANFFAASGGPAFVDVDLPPACTWTASSSAPWLTLGRNSGAGGGRIPIAAQANSGTLRSATVTIATGGPTPNISRIVVVNQGPAAALPSLSLSARSGSYPAAATAGAVEIMTEPGILWNAYSSEPWAVITSAANGTGPGPVTFNLLTNPATTPRTALLTIGGQIYTISQLGQSCLFGLSPSSTALPAAGGAGSFVVGITGTGCPYSAVSSVPWIAVTPPVDNVVSYAVAANSASVGRTGTIQVADQLFTVNQAGSSCAFSLTQSSQIFFASGGNGAATLNTPGGCPWTAASSAPWVTVTSSANNTGPGVAIYTVTANTSASRRTATLFLGGQNYIVIQAGTGEGNCTASVPTVPTADAEGLTEPLGELLLSCSGLPLPLDTDLELTLNAPITNRPTDLLLSVNGAAALAAAQPGPNRLRWAGLRLPAGASTLRFSGLRANASFFGRPASFQANPIIANLAFSTPLTITNPAATLAQAAVAVAFSAGTVVRPSGSTLASGLVLFREAQPNAIRPGARLRLTVSNIPAGTELLLPIQPADGSLRARLLSANVDGSGGSPVAPNRINNTYFLASATAGTVVATWEILTADALLTENFDFQLLFNNALPADLPGLRFLGGFGPISNVTIASATAPIPRYREPDSALRRTNLRLTSQFLTASGAVPSSKPGAIRALFGAGTRLLLEQTITNESQPEAPAATNTIVRNNIAGGLLLRTCAAPCTPQNSQPVFPVGDLAPGASRTYRFEVEIASGLADGTPLYASGDASSDDPPADVNTTYASSTILFGGVPFALALTPGSVTVPATAGTGQIQLSTIAVNLPWTAVSSASWLTITPPSGTGAASLTYSHTANPAGDPRQATITAGGAVVTVTQSAAPPAVAVTGPIASAGATQSFVFRFSHPGGFQNLGVVNALINKALDGGNACYIAYSVPAGALFLVNDAGPANGLSSPLLLGSGSSVSNSQCQINGTGSSATGSGNVLTLTLNIGFKSGFAGNQVVYLAARDSNAGNSGWHTMGYHAVPGAPVTYPNALSMAPASGSTAASPITFTYEDQSNANNIQTTWALINTALDARGACYVAYYAPGNLLLLIPDNGDAGQASAIPLTGSNVLENSQCRITAQGSSVTKTGARLALTLNLTFKPAFAGPKAAWLALQTLTSVTAPWKAAGAWLVPQ